MQSWPSEGSPNVQYMHDYTEVLLGDLAPGNSPQGIPAQDSLSGGQDIKPYGSGPADKKRRRDEELGLKQWMENLGKPDPPEDLHLHDDSLLFSSPGAQDFSLPGSFGMPCGMGGVQGEFDVLASEAGLVQASRREDQLVLPAWETMPADNRNLMEGEAHCPKGDARIKGGGRGGRGRGAAATVPLEDLTESEKTAVSKAGRERARRERLNDSFNELSELLDPGKPSRTDKVSVIADAVKAITQLRAEAHQLRQLNKFLEERVSHSEKEKSHLMMQQALITQFMQTGQPVVLGGPQPAANFWGQQQPPGPAPRVPASGQSMGQAVADISSGLRLMQQSSGSSLPPWPLPPGAQSQGAGPSHVPVSAPASTTGAPIRPGGTPLAPSPRQQQQQEAVEQWGAPKPYALSLGRTQSPFQSSPTSQVLRSGSGGGGVSSPGPQGAARAPPQQQRPQSALAAPGVPSDFANLAPSVVNTEDLVDDFALAALLPPAMLQPQLSQSQHQLQHFASEASAQNTFYAPQAVQQAQQQQQQQPFVAQQYMELHPYPHPPAEYGGYQPVQQQGMHSSYMQGPGGFDAGPAKPAHLIGSHAPVPVMPGPFWLGGLDTDTSNDHVRRPPAA